MAYITMLNQNLKSPKENEMALESVNLPICFEEKANARLPSNFIIYHLCFDLSALSYR